MRRLQLEAFRWSSEAFGDADVCGPEKPLAHLRSEIDEILAAPQDHPEWADGLLLLLSGMSRARIAVEDVIDAAWDKLDKNRKRKWGPMNAEGYTEHVKPERVDLIHGDGNTLSTRLRGALIDVLARDRGIDKPYRWGIIAKELGAVTWDDLERVDHRVILRVKNFGKVTLREFERVLAERKGEA